MGAGGTVCRDVCGPGVGAVAVVSSSAPCLPQWTLNLCGSARASQPECSREGSVEAGGAVILHVASVLGSSCPSSGEQKVKKRLG